METKSKKCVMAPDCDVHELLFLFVIQNRYDKTHHHMTVAATFQKSKFETEQKKKKSSFLVPTYRCQQLLSTRTKYPHIFHSCSATDSFKKSTTENPFLLEVNLFLDAFSLIFLEFLRQKIREIRCLPILCHLSYFLSLIVVLGNSWILGRLWRH